MPQEVNQIVSFVFDDETSFSASTGYKPEDQWKVAYIKSTKKYKVLSNATLDIWDDISFSKKDLLRQSYYPTIADGLVATYKSRVIAAGDTITEKELSALKDTLSILMQSSGFFKLRELWVPMGTSALTGAMVKIIADSTAGTSMTPNNLISGDYTATAGITGNGTNKYINTGFNPTAAAVQTDGWGFGVFGLNTAGSGALGGTVTGFNTYLMYSSLNDTRYNNIQMSNTLQFPRFCAVQGNVTEAVVYHGGANWLSVPYTAATLPNANLGLLTANGGNYSSQSVAGYAAWGVPLTQEELNNLAEFFDAINVLLGRQVFKPSMSAVGDSNARGIYVPAGGTAITNKWSAQVATALGLTDANSGVDDSTMSDDTGGLGTGGWITTRRAVGTFAKAPALLVVMLGTTAARSNVTPENPKEDYAAWLRYQVLTGFSSRQIILTTPIAATDTATNPTNQENLAKFSQIIRDLAGSFDCKLCDLNQITSAAAGIFQPDKLHLNQAGHNLVAASILKSIQQI